MFSLVLMQEGESQVGGPSPARQGVARLRVVLLLAATVAAAIVAGCSEGSSDEEQSAAPATVVTSRPAVAFAPLVHLWEREYARPISADDFVDHSSLTMANEPCLSQETVAIGGPRLRMKRDAPAPVLDVRRLGGERPYRQRSRTPDCNGHHGQAYATDQHTRPFDRGRPASLRPHEGYYLDLLTERLPGTADYRRDGEGQLRVSSAPVYYETRDERVDGEPGLRITYWLLFGLEGYDSGTPAGDALTNEGDWERVSVLLRRGSGRNRWEPVSVGYLIHGRRRDVPWTSAELASGDGEGAPTHPVVYVARGNHAPYPQEGETMVRYDVPGPRTVRAPDKRRACSDCPRWSAWEQLRPIDREPWYGYGGAWGAVGYTAQGTGPIGPSPYTR